MISLGSAFTNTELLVQVFQTSATGFYLLNEVGFKYFAEDFGIYLTYSII